MNNIALMGPFNSGKTTVFNALQEKYKHDDRFYFVEEHASKAIKARGKRPHEMTKAELADFQMEIFEVDLREEQKAAEQEKIAIFDSSMVEAIAYAQNIVNDQIYKVLNNILRSRAHTYNAIYFPPKSRIKLEDNGIRHVTKDNEADMKLFQHVIADRIKLLLKEHNIAYYTLDALQPDRRLQIASAKIETLAKGVLSR